MPTHDRPNGKNTGPHRSRPRRRTSQSSRRRHPGGRQGATIDDPRVPDVGVCRSAGCGVVGSTVGASALQDCPLCASRTSAPDRTMSSQFGQVRGWSTPGGVNTSAYRSVTCASQFWHSGISEPRRVPDVGEGVVPTARTRGGVLSRVRLGALGDTTLVTRDQTGRRCLFRHTTPIPAGPYKVGAYVSSRGSERLVSLTRSRRGSRAPERGSSGWCAR